MRLTFVLAILLLTGYATSLHATDLPDPDLGPVAQSCLTDPPAATETFMVSLCEGFADIARKREAQAQGKIEATTCDAVCRYPADKLRENHEAIAAGKIQAAQWTRSVRATRIPSLEELDRELAILESWRPPRPPMPMMFSCTSFMIGMVGNTDCY